MTFQDAYPLLEGVPGWLTEPQAEVLFEAAAGVRAGGTIVEIGSHHGRSTIALAAGNPEARVVAIDPFLADWRYGAPNTESRCRENLGRAGLSDRVDLLVTTSRQARQDWAGTVDLLYIDGKHDYWTVRDDLRWTHRLAPGGTVLVHDAFSSLGVTIALCRDVLVSRRLRYLGRTGSLARLEARRPGAADRLRFLAQVPWWIRNLVVKALLRLRLRSVAGLLGHRDTADPY